jgi:hypothetical protein
MNVHSIGTQPTQLDHQSLAVRPPTPPSDTKVLTVPAAPELHLGNHIDTRA